MSKKKVLAFVLMIFIPLRAMAGIYFVLVPDDMFEKLELVEVKVSKKSIKLEPNSFQGVFGGDVDGQFNVYSNEQLWFIFSELNDQLLIIPRKRCQTSFFDSKAGEDEIDCGEGLLSVALRFGDDECNGWVGIDWDYSLSMHDGVLSAEVPNGYYINKSLDYKLTVFLKDGLKNNENDELSSLLKECEINNEVYHLLPEEGGLSKQGIAHDIIKDVLVDDSFLSVFQEAGSILSPPEAVACNNPKGNSNPKKGCGSKKGCKPKKECKPKQEEIELHKELHKELQEVSSGSRVNVNKVNGWKKVKGKKKSNLDGQSKGQYTNVPGVEFRSDCKMNPRESGHAFDDDFFKRKKTINYIGKTASDMSRHIYVKRGAGDTFQGVRVVTTKEFKASKTISISDPCEKDKRSHSSSDRMMGLYEDNMVNSCRPGAVFLASEEAVDRKDKVVNGLMGNIIMMEEIVEDELVCEEKFNRKYINELVEKAHQLSFQGNSINEVEKYKEEINSVNLGLEKDVEKTIKLFCELVADDFIAHSNDNISNLIKSDWEDFVKVIGAALKNKAFLNCR